MLRIVTGKAMRVGRATVFLMGLALMLALVFGMVSTAFGANGGNFILGSVNNTATAITRLTGNVDGGPALRISNPSTAAGSTALDLQVETGKAPMKVNSGTKVVNLNADKVDGKDSMALGVTMKTEHESTGDVTTTGGCTSFTAWRECAPVTVKVPTGRQYHVTVWSSFAAYTENGPGFLYYCPAVQGGSIAPTLKCVTPDGGTVVGDAGDEIKLADEYVESASISGEIGPLPAGTYTFSTVLNPTQKLWDFQGRQRAHTTVMVRDASVSGPPID